MGNMFRRLVFIEFKYKLEREKGCKKLGFINFSIQDE